MSTRTGKLILPFAVKLTKIWTSHWFQASMRSAEYQMASLLNFLTITRMFWQSSSQNHFRIVTSPNGMNSQCFQKSPSAVCDCITISPFINKSEAYFFMWIYLEMKKLRQTQERYFHPQRLSSKWLSYRHSTMKIKCTSCLVKYRYRLRYHMHFLLHRGRRHRFLLCIN